MKQVVLLFSILAVAFAASNVSPLSPALEIPLSRDAYNLEKQKYALNFANYFSSKLDVTQHYGYIPVNQKYNANLFYWLFEAQNKSDDLVLWLTGGPGCSSELALFFENGPYQIDPKTLQLKDNPYSWNKNANLMYVDQPAGTGFSYASSDYIGNETMVAEEMWNFFLGFFAKYPQYANMNFFITGESYAGHYIPAIGARIIQENAKKQTINLQGLAIGDGLINTEITAGSWAPYLYGMGKISEADMNDVQDNYWSKCKRDIDNGNWRNAFFSCNQVIQMCLSYAGNINVYDIREPCKVPPLCYDMSYIAKYLNQPSVQQHLGVHKTWVACNYQVYAPFEAKDFDYSYEFDLPIILKQNRLLIYNGFYDLIVDFYGTSAMLDTMDWDGQNGFVNAPNTTWHVGGQHAGSSRTYANLTYLLVDNAGHMVPYDQPKNALDMLNRFLKNMPFN